MLLGEPPFTGPTAQAIIAKVMTEKPAGLIARRDRVPEAVEDAVLTALEKLPADRFASAAEFAGALAGRSDGQTVRRSAQGASSRRPTVRPSVRLSVLSGALLLAAALAAWGWSRSAPPAATSRQRVVLWRHSLGRFLSPGLEHLATQAAIAPDGSSIVFADTVGTTVQLLRKRRKKANPPSWPGPKAVYRLSSPPTGTGSDTSQLTVACGRCRSRVGRHHHARRFTQLRLSHRSLAGRWHDRLRG